MKTAHAPVVRIFLLVCCLLAATACDEETPTGPTVPLNERFVLAPAGVAVIADTGVSLQFVGVTGDSRCPADAFCIQGGDATVHVRILDSGETRGYELHTGDSRRATFTHRNIRVELLELQPYPFSSRTIDPSEYRATFAARR